MNVSDDPRPKALRADVKRNSDLLLQAALAVFSTSGVDAPIREIAEKAGVGVATLYRHFPQRSDLIVAVFQKEVDACVDAATEFAATCPPGEALSQWIHRYTGFIAAKRGLAPALHSGDPAYAALPNYFLQRLEPALQGLLDAAIAAGEIRSDVKAVDLLRAIGNLCMATPGDDPAHAQKMVSLVVDGLRYGAQKQG